MIFEKDKAKQNVLFIHGFGSSANFWFPLKSTNRNYNMIAVSLDLKDNSTIKTFAAQVKEFVKENNLDDLTVVGHSMGCSVAFYLNEISPVKKLILLSPHNAFLKNQEDTRRWVTPQKLEDAIASFDNLVYNSSIWKDNIESMAKRYLSYVESHYTGLNNVFETSIFNQATKNELSNIYEQISIPVSIITGRDDKFVSVESVNAMEKYGFKIVALPETGHAILVDNLKEVSKFIAQEIEA